MKFSRTTAGCIAWHGDTVKKPALSVCRPFIFAMVQDGKPKTSFINKYCPLSILDQAA